MSDYTIKDESSNHNYRTELPNIIYEIGLTPNLIGIYSAIKRCAGDHGHCTKSEKTLSKQLNITKKTLHAGIMKLCEVNKILKKALVTIMNRFSECGDKETNLITIIDIWPENYAFFSSNSGGRVKITPPRVKITQGVGEILPYGRVKFTHKEEPFKKNHIKKTTTSTPSSSKKADDDDDVFQKQQAKAINKAALSLKEWLDSKSTRIRKRKIGKGHYEDVSWGNSWEIPLSTYEFLIGKYGFDYFQDQLTHMVRCQEEFDEGLSKKEIGKPETVLKLACKNNYAGSIYEKKEVT